MSDLAERIAAKHREIINGGFMQWGYRTADEIRRECRCPRCRGERCGCATMNMPPCGVCTESCDPDDPETRVYDENCGICGCFECGCGRKSC